MNPYSLMLQKASIEMRQFQQTSPEASHFAKGWFEQLVVRLEQASQIDEAALAEREILAIARSDIDSGPMSEDAMPSFYLALGAVQKNRKRRSA